MKDHKASILKGDKSSALSEHLATLHVSSNKELKIFVLSILYHGNKPQLTAIKEAQFIDQMNPKLNRKHELAAL